MGSDAAFVVCMQLIVITCPKIAEDAEHEAFVIVRSVSVVVVVGSVMVIPAELFVSLDDVLLGLIFN